MTETKHVEAELTSLAAAREGANVRMVSADCGRGLCARLASMGMRPGMTLRVIKSAPPGPLVVAVGNARIGIGRGMAFKIMVAEETSRGGAAQARDKTDKLRD